MSETKQIKINKNLHNQVSEFVDSSASDYSSYKSFYEQATREHLDREKGNKVELTDQEKRLVKDLYEERSEK